MAFPRPANCTTVNYAQDASRLELLRVITRHDLEDVEWQRLEPLLARSPGRGGKLEQFRAVATRYDKRAWVCPGTVDVA
jgi:hypothetical protein